MREAAHAKDDICISLQTCLQLCAAAVQHA